MLTAATTVANIRATIAIKQITVRDLSASTGIQYDALRRRLSGKGRLTLDELLHIAAALDVPPASLMSGEHLVARAA